MKSILFAIRIDTIWNRLTQCIAISRAWKWYDNVLTEKADSIVTTYGIAHISVQVNIVA